MIIYIQNFKLQVFHFLVSKAVVVSPDVMNVAVVVNKAVLPGEVAGEQDAAGLVQVVGVGCQVGDGLAGKLHGLGVVKLDA